MLSICSEVCVCSKPETASASSLERSRKELLTKSRSTLGVPTQKIPFGADSVDQPSGSPWGLQEPEDTPEVDSEVSAIEFPGPQELAQHAAAMEKIFDSVTHNVCILGSITEGHDGSALIEPEYQEKRLEYSRPDVDDCHKIMAELDAAISCKKGKKPYQPNQDNISFCKIGQITLCIVADGHGPDGHYVSHWAVRFVLRLLMPEIAETGMLPGNGILKRVFDLTHRALQEHSKASKFDLMMSGSTLSVCLIEHAAKRVVVAWVGDSRCIVGRSDGSGGVSLTRDHKPNIKTEHQRIVAHGGEVLKMQGDIPHRVFIKNHELPGLAMSRAVGDCLAHSIGVIHIPDIVRYEVEEHFVLCCSDGVWEFIDSKEAARIVGSLGRRGVRGSVEALVQEAQIRWLREEVSTTDDISAICIYV